MPRKKKLETSIPQVAINGQSWPMFADADSNPKYMQTALAAAASSNRRETNEMPLQSFPSLDTFISPFRTSAGGAYMDTREAIRLSIKAYWAFPLLRNVVEVMGELSNSNLYLKGGNKKTRDFLDAWFNKINLWHLKEQFFREWFRSANVFIYRFDGDFSPSDITKMTQVYGALGGRSIPVKYLILNPESITAAGTLVFDQVSYFKVLNAYEIARIKNPVTPQDQAFVSQLDPKTLKAIQREGGTNLQLDPERLSVLLYKAQPYEPMGVPMCYGVLRDIDAKLELKRIDLSMARTTDRALLLLTVGETPNQWHKGGNINHNTIAALQSLFANEGISRTLIADYTVKGDWLIPDIGKILGPEKYTQLDKDINVGLNAILFNDGEKFANTSIKVQIFIERLREARNAFVKNFLEPEIKRVCQAINAKNIPEVCFEDLSLKDELQYAKIFVQLAQLGLLTPEELFEAMENGRLPIAEESLEHQKAFKELREQGYYLPLVGGAAEIQKQQLDVQQQQVDNQLELGKESNKINAVKAVQPKASAVKKPVGRPSGSKAPKAATKPTPVGSGKARASLDGYSISKFHDYVPLVSNLHNEVEKGLKKKFGIRKLNQAQESIAKQLVTSILANESEDKWTESVSEYLVEPKEINEAVAAELDELQIRHDLQEAYVAAILRLTKSQLEEEEEDAIA